MAPEAEAGIGHNKPPLSEVLAERYDSVAQRVSALAERANAAPRAIKTDADLEAIATIVRDSRELTKDAEKHREAEKAPHLKAGRDVDQFFKVHTDRLGKITTFFQSIADDHARAKAAEARRKAEEEARKAREEAERQSDIARRAAEANRPTASEKHELKAEAAYTQAEQAQAIAESSAADLTRVRHGSGILTTARAEVSFQITDYEAIPLNHLRPYLKRDHVEAAIRAFVKFHKTATPLPGVRIFEDVKASIR